MIITRRKLQELGLRWPAPHPSDLDAPIDIESEGERLWWDVNEARTAHTGDRAMLDELYTLMKRLDELGIVWRKAK